MESKYIKGEIFLRYSGEDQQRSSNDSSKRFYGIVPYEAQISEAESIEGFDYDILSNQGTYNPAYLGGIKVKFRDGQSQELNLINVVIQNVKLHDVISKDGKTYGSLTGTVYAKVDDLVRSDKRGGTNSNLLTTNKTNWWGCILKLLSIIGFFALMLILWCFLFGDCNYKQLTGDCPICPEPVVLRDTVVVRGDDRVVVVTDTIRTDDDGLGTGELQISLFWENQEDVDLVVKTPDGYIYFGNKRTGGGYMDKDINASEPLTTNASENIFWDRSIPAGKYEVYALYYRKRKTDETPVPFRIRIKFKGQEKSFEGEVSKPLNDLANINTSRFYPESVQNLRHSVKVHEFSIEENNQTDTIF